MAEIPPLHERYRIVRKLGTGAFATVYLADDQQMGRPVAVKIVQHSADLEDRVLREAQAAAKLNHHHILTVYEMVRERDRTLLFSEYIHGKTLRQHYRDRSLSDLDLLEVGVQMCHALAHAHKRGVVHRDIKPENLMLVDGDVVDVRLMDFGVVQLEDRASITLTGDLVGTLAYMSPEQAEGRNVDSRSDVYSLALTLYEGFVRRDPSEGKRFRRLLLDVSRPEIPPLLSSRPDLPKRLSDVLEKALTRDRYARPDAASLGRMLTQARELMVGEGRLPTRTQVRPKPSTARARSYWTQTAADRSRLVYVGQHIVSAGLALCCLAYVLTRVPFYPSAVITPLVVVCAFAALMWPFGGGVLALALMAPPFFAYGTGWGIIYVVPAVLTMALLRWRRSEWAALIPGVIPLAVAGYVGLALLPLTGAFLRRWGAWVGFMSGLVLAVTGGLVGWQTLPYTFNRSPGATLTAAKHAGSPGTVLAEIGRFFQSRPEMALQVLLFAVFSLPLYAWIGRTPTMRIWGMSVYLILVLLAFVLMPILILGAPVGMGPLLVTYAPCAIITFLLSFLVPSMRGGSL
jgi:MFS family permease